MVPRVKTEMAKSESYHWQQISGPSIALDNVNAIKSNFISPAVNQDTMLASIAHCYGWLKASDPRILR